MSRPSTLFELDRVLGSGATGVVWHGVLCVDLEDVPAGTEVAVKYLREELRDDPRACAAFEREALAGSLVLHPGLIRVLERKSDERGPRTVMTFVPGDTLREVLDETGALPEPQVRAVGEQLAGALDALHAAGWTHGDVKPENVRLDREGGAVLLDLGFARSTAPDEPDRTAGSLPYLAPEVASGQAAGPQSDVFALGVLLFELATGNHPFLDAEGSTDRTRSDSNAVLTAMRHARFVPPSRVRPQISPFLDLLLEELLDQDAGQRPTAAQVEERLQQQESHTWWRESVGSRHGAEPRRKRTPLVGRDRELAALEESFLEAVSGDEPGGGAVWLTGAAGSGKSRLVQEFVRRARHGETPPQFLYGRCPEHVEARPAQPILRLLSRYLWLSPASAPGTRERELLSGLVPPAAAETLLQALDPLFTGTTEQSVQTALGEWLRALGRRTPLVVFLDDVHRSGADTLSVLLRLAESRGGSGLFLVIGLRDSEREREPAMLQTLHERLADRGSLREISLRPLSERDVGAAVDELFDHGVPRLRLAHVLWRRTRGNPGFLAELLRGMLARGDARALDGTDGKLTLTVSPDELPLPDSLAQTIREAYRALSRTDRLWLRRMAVVGGRIRQEFLQRAFPGSAPAEISGSLRRLVQSGWLEPASDRYRFARPALREAVYRSLDAEARVQMHAAAAKALRSPSGRPLGLDDAFQRAFHLRAAGEHARLLRLIEPLLQRLLDRGQPQRVHTLATWGLEAVAALSPSKELDRRRVAFLEAAADAADRLGYRHHQRATLDQLTDLELDLESDAELLGRVYLLHGRYAVSVGQYGLGGKMLRNAADLCRRAENIGAAGEALRRLALVKAHLGELEASRALAAEANELAQSDHARALVLLVRGNIELLEGAIEPALRVAERAVKLLRRGTGRNGLVGVAAAQLLRARAYRATGRPLRALASAQRAIRAARQAGERRMEAEAGARLGGLLLDIDAGEEAEARLREALRLAEEIEDARGRVLAGAFLGILLAEAGDPEASGLLVRTAELARETGLNRAEALVLAIRARTCREAGDRHQAEELAGRAVELVEVHGAETADRVVVIGTRALLRFESGDVAESRRLVKALRNDLRRQNQRIVNPTLKRRHRLASTRLLAAVLSPEGPVFPRVRVALDLLT